MSAWQTLVNVILPQAVRLTIRRSPTARSRSPGTALGGGGGGEILAGAERPSPPNPSPLRSARSPT
jgi:hypothetical protein